MDKEDIRIIVRKTSKDVILLAIKIKLGVMNQEIKAAP